MKTYKKSVVPVSSIVLCIRYLLSFNFIKYKILYCFRKSIGATDIKKYDNEF